MNKLDVRTTASELYLGHCRYNCNQKTKGGNNKVFVATELNTDSSLIASPQLAGDSPRCITLRKLDTLD